MSNYSILKGHINSAIYQNDTQDISGTDMNSILKEIVESFGAGYLYMGVATPSTAPGTPDQNVFYIAGTEGTYTNFGGITVANEVAVLKYNGAWSKQNTGIKFVSVSQNTLSIGGEEVGELAGQLVENPEWVKVVTDSEDKILYGVKTDGKFYFGDGCPPQVVEYVTEYVGEQLGSFNAQDYADIKTFLGSLIDGDTLATLLNAKVDKVTGKSLIDADFAENTNYIQNPEWLEVKTDLDGRIIQGIRKDGSTYLARIETNKEILDELVDDLVLDSHLKDASGVVVVTPNMSKEQFIDKINNRFRNEYATLCHCNPECFDLLKNTFSESKMYDVINNNFRKEICVDGMSMSTICARINNAFTEPIYRFCDAKPWDNDGNTRYFGYSIQVFPEDENHQDEPSAIVSEDGSKLYLYAHMKRYESYDGINFSNGTELEYERSLYGYVQHVNVNYINGVYYLIGVTQDGAGVMNFYTSTDGVNFTYQGSLFYPRGTQGPFDIMGDGSIMASAYGNTSLVYANGIWYLYYEWGNDDSGKWEFGLATCTDILHDNGDGTVGNWTPSDVNPICPGVGIRNGEEWVYSCGNPDFAKGMTNQIIKSNGKYYMYFHGAYGGSGSGGLHNYSAMYRAYSEDLVHWTIEDGLCFDNRDISDSDRPVGGNSDQCVIEFKGRTFFYYTHNINNADLYAPHIRVLIDERCFSEILKLKP